MSDSRVHQVFFLPVPIVCILSQPYGPTGKRKLSPASLERMGGSWNVIDHVRISLLATKRTIGDRPYQQMFDGEG